jgi:predicted O-methyltransferase YrrM
VIKRKIRKYNQVITSVLRTNSELNRIHNSNVSFGQKVVEVYKKVKNNQIDESEKIIFDQLEEHRVQLLNDHTPVTYEMFNSSKVSTISEVCKSAASPLKWGAFYYLLTEAINAKKVLEIGTNLGISGQYFLKALPNNEHTLFVTLEGHPQFCKIASNRFHEVAPKSKINVIEGLYDNTFDKLLEIDEKFDLVFIDGNHKRDATIDYYKKLKINHFSDNVLIIFDDIHWSEGMVEAWDEIKKDDNISLTIDMYKMGIAIYQKNRSDEKAIHTKLFLTF